MCLKPNKKIAHCRQWQAISQYIPYRQIRAKSHVYAVLQGLFSRQTTNTLEDHSKDRPCNLAVLKVQSVDFLLLVTSILASCHPVQWDLDFWTFLNCFATLSWHLLPYKRRIDLCLIFYLACLDFLEFDDLKSRRSTCLVSCMTTLRHLGSQHSDGGL